MDDQTRRKLDTNEALQTLILSAEWAKDSLGLLANKAIKLCIANGATEGEAYQYLEIE